MVFWQIQNILTFVLGIVVLVLALWAFVDCARRPANLFPYIDRKSKSLWLILTGIGALIALIVVANPVNLFGIASIVLSLIYLFDLRPKMDQVSTRRF